MTEPVQLYRVSYSGRVRQRLKELGREALQRGDGPQFVAALKEFYRLLPLYPQFGEPYLDLKAEAGQIYKGLSDRSPCGMPFMKSGGSSWWPICPS